MLIVDDDVPFTRFMAQALRAHVPEALLDTCHDPAAALCRVETEAYDIFLLDIMMPGATGIELARRIRQSPANKTAWIIFITAVEDMRRDAIDEAQCYAYLTKPVQIKQVADMLRKLAGHKIMPVQKQYFAYRHGGIQARVLLDDILYFEMQQKNLYIRTQYDNTVNAGRKTLAHTLRQLPPGRFCQCHRSFLVNLDCVEAVRREEPSCLTLRYRGNRCVTVPLGQMFKENIIIH